MSIATTTPGYALAAEEGTPLWMLGGLFTIKASRAQTGGAFALAEFNQPAGTEPPPHIHRNEDEAFYVLEGEMAVMCGDDRFRATSGSFVFLPRGVVHGFTIVGEQPLRGLVLTAPAGFEQFITEMGEPALTRTIPAGGPPDMEKLMTLTAKYGIELQIPAG